MSIDQITPEATPGAMAVHKSRPLPSGHLITFESAPAGWLKKDGKPRKQDWRAYYVSPAGEERAWAHRVESVTTMLDRILPKPGLPPWSETAGIIGARSAMRDNLVDGASTELEWVQAVRAHHLGADALRDRATDRGLNVHAILEEYMTTGQPPNPADHPEPHRPFIRGLVRALLRFDLTPVAVELLVADPENGYAGRLDLLAYRGKRLTLIDLKTQENGAIYESAHLQVRLYWEAERRFGEYEIDDAMVIVVDGAGGFNEMDLCADAELAEDALSFYRRLKPLCSATDARNRVVREAIGAV